jgi:hypothetical protein
MVYHNDRLGYNFYFYLHLQDVGNRVTLMTLLSPCIWLYHNSPLCNVEFRFGTPNMDP